VRPGERFGEDIGPTDNRIRPDTHGVWSGAASDGRLGELSEADAADRRAQLAAVSADWTLLRIGAEAVERARQPFPGAPLRTLDAIHLASLLVARSAIAGL